MSAAVKAWLLEGDRWVASEELPATDRAVRYGMSVFETIGVRDGKFLFLNEHLALLKVSANALLAPAGSTVLGGRLPTLGAADTGVLRLYLTAGDGSPTAPVTAPRAFALFESQSSPVPDSQTARAHPAPIAPFAGGSKTGNYWTQCAAQSEAVEAGYDHALLSDHDGRVLSGAFGNLFFVLDGNLCTPSLSLAVRPGVVRAWVARQQNVREVELPAAHLGEASELFLTNSRLGVMPLQLGGIAPGPVGRTLRQAILREKLVP